MIEIRCLWMCTPLIPAQGGQGQADLCEFRVSLMCIASFQRARVIQ